MNSRQLAKQWPFPRHKEFSKNLRATAAKWFSDHQFATHPRMPFCLADWNNWKQNIILDEVSAYIKAQSEDALARGKPFPLHKYLHHGLSSQAMAFNLIGPLITSDDFSPLMELLKAKGVHGADDVKSAKFEYEDRDVFNEDAGQPTSMDVVLKNSSGEPFIFIESKLDEQEFGGCSVFSAGDCDGMNPIGCEDRCFLHFIGRHYWRHMAKYGITESVKSDRQCLFVAHYQFFREVILAREKNGVFILLHDERSPVFHCRSRSGEQERGLFPFLKSLLPEQLKAYVSSMTIQELVGVIKKHERHREWIGEFEKKYGLA